MPKILALHFNPLRNKGITRCGKKLGKLKWTSDANDTTCNLCLRLIEKDRKLLRSG